MAKSARKHVGLRKKEPRGPFDYVVYFFTFVTPLFELPQAYEIFSRQSAQDVSVWTWAFFCIDNFVWIAYAIRNGIRPVLITSILYEIIELTILAGIILYH
jgi:uncharacterized protein with PQ loop repeat